MLGALGSADKYSTASVTHTTGLSWHCWIQILQNWPPAPRPSPSAPTESHSRWLGCLEKVPSVVLQEGTLGPSALRAPLRVCNFTHPRSPCISVAVLNDAQARHKVTRWRGASAGFARRRRVDVRRVTRATAHLLQPEGFELEGDVMSLCSVGCDRRREGP